MLLLLASASGCRCGPPRGEVAGLTFVRCADLDPPEAGSVRAGTLTLSVEGRVLSIEGASALRVAAFTGPVGAALSARELGLLAAAEPELVLHLGGLGDTEALARDSLARLATLRVPVVFVPGGGDRAAVIEAAFAALAADLRGVLVNASGLRLVRFGRLKLALVPGAALGRYARDDGACGFQREDLDALREAVRVDGPAERLLLVSWHAPLGFGVSTGAGGAELGSPELAQLAAALSASGGVFAFPETQAGLPPGPRAAVAVRRLGVTGSLRADGSLLGPGVTVVELGADGGFSTP